MGRRSLYTEIMENCKDHAPANFEAELFKTWAPGVRLAAANGDQQEVKSRGTVALTEAAEVVGLPPDVFRREWAKESLPTWKGSTHHYRVALSDLETFFNRRWQGV